MSTSRGWNVIDEEDGDETEEDANPDERNAGENHGNNGLYTDYNHFARDQANVNSTSIGGQNSLAVDSLVEVVQKTTAAMADSLIKIRPCVTDEAKAAITRREFTEWRSQTLLAVKNMSDHDAYFLIRRGGGKQLMGLLDSLDIEGDIAEDVEPFKRSIEALDKHFNEHQNTLASTIRFRSTFAIKGETNVTYINRLLAEAKLCGFPKNTIGMEVVATILTNSRSEQLKIKATEPDITLEKLRMFASQIDVAEGFNKSNKEQEKKFAAVNQLKTKRRQGSESSDESDPPRPARKQRREVKQEDRYDRDNDGRRGYHRPPQPSRNMGARNKTSVCFRCLSKSHEQYNCKAKHEKCRFCDKVGHTERACYSKRDKISSSRNTKQDKSPRSPVKREGDNQKEKPKGAKLLSLESNEDNKVISGSGNSSDDN